MKKAIYFMLLFAVAFLSYGEKIAEFDDIYNPTYFMVDGDDLYALDEKIVKLYSIKEQKMISKIGKRGEGPGEYKKFPFFTILPDRIFISDYSKILFFRRNGDFIREQRIPEDYTLDVVKDNYLVRENIFDLKNRKIEIRAWIGDSKLKKIKTLFTFNRDFRSSSKKEGNKRVVDRNVFMGGNISLVYDDKIYVYDRSKGFNIEIYDCTGRLVKRIKKQTKPEKVSNEFKEKFIAFQERNKLKITGGITFEWNYLFPEYFPAIDYLKAEKDKIYITSFTNDGENQTISIIDFQGNILKKTRVPFMNKSTIHAGKFYYFVDNEEDEVWELHSINL